MPDGTTMSFDVINSPVMEKGLAVKYPEISTYKGRSIEDELINIRFSISPRGFFASVYWPENNIYIDVKDLREKTEVYIYSISGELIYTKTLSDLNTTISLALTKGIYLVNIVSNTGHYKKKLFIN